MNIYKRIVSSLLFALLGLGSSLSTFGAASVATPTTPPLTGRPEKAGKPENMPAFNVKDIIDVNIDDPVIQEQLKAFGLSDAELADVRAAQEQLKALDQKELDKLQQDFDTMFSKLNELTESDLEFLKDADETQIEEFMRNRFGSPEEFVNPTPAPAAPVKKEEKKPVVPKINTKHQKAIDLLETLIHGSDLLLVKISTMPEFPLMFEKWEKTEKTRFGMDWPHLRGRIERLIQKLRAIMSRDPKTKEYKLLDEFIKNESLYNNLEKMKATIAKFEPLVEEFEPLISSSISAQSKNAIQKLLNQYIEALTVLKVPDALDAVIATYEPIAQKMREEEAMITQKAEQESKRMRPQKGKVEAGSRNDFDFGYNPPVYTVPTYAPFTASFGTGATTTPATSPTTGPTTSGNQKKDEAKGPSKEGDKPKGEEKKDKGGSSAAPAKSGTQKSKGKPEEKPLSPEMQKAGEKVDSVMKEIANDLADANKVAKKNNLFDNLVNHLTDKEVLNTQLVNEDLPALATKLDNASNNIMKAADRLSSASDSVRKQYKQKIEAEVKKQDKLSTVLKQLDEMERNQDWHNKMAPIKRYVYLKEEPKIDSSLTSEEEKKYTEEYIKNNPQPSARFFYRKFKDSIDQQTKVKIVDLLKEKTDQSAIKAFELMEKALKQKVENLQKDLGDKIAAADIKQDKVGGLAAVMASAKKLKGAIDAVEKKPAKKE